VPNNFGYVYCSADGSSPCFYAYFFCSAMKESDASEYIVHYWFLSDQDSAGLSHVFASLLVYFLSGFSKLFLKINTLWCRFNVLSGRLQIGCGWLQFAVFCLSIVTVYFKKHKFFFGAVQTLLKNPNLSILPIRKPESVSGSLRFGRMVSCF